MKTALSIPDESYEGAERLARRATKSRRRLYGDALREHLARHVPEEVTEAMNRACAEMGEAKDPLRFDSRAPHPGAQRVVIS